MNVVASIKTAIVAKLNALEDPGQVTDYPGALLDMEGDPLQAGEFITVVVRNGTSEQVQTVGRAGRNARTYNIEIHLHLPWDETNGALCEARFDDRMEAVSDMFLLDPTLGGLVSLSDPLLWVDDPDLGFRTVRGGVLARYRRGVLRVHVLNRRG